MDRRHRKNITIGITLLALMGILAGACTVRSLTAIPEPVPPTLAEQKGPAQAENHEESDREPETWYTEEELEILAIIIYQEAGANAISDETRLMVGNVFLNRVYSDGFPDTFREVALQARQYGTLHWTGIRWPERAQDAAEEQAVQRAYDIAKRLLDGERVLDEDVVWQAEFQQGTEVVAYSDGIYFCR